MASSCVPSSTLKDEPKAIGTILRSSFYFLYSFFGDICLNVQLVELSTTLCIGCNDLLDGCKIGLGVEELGDHDDFGRSEWIISEEIELLDSLE